MQLVDIRLLFDYNSWATRRILSFVRHVSAKQYVEPNSYPCGNLRDTLIHILTAERSWLARWQEQDARPGLTAADLPTLDDVIDQWRQDEGRLHAYLATLTDAGLHVRISYILGDGTPATDWRWAVMALSWLIIRPGSSSDALDGAAAISATLAERRPAT